MPRNIRLLCTHDYYGAYAPLPTSYGSLPGGRALSNHIAGLRAGRTAIWADSGDFIQGGPLEWLSDGRDGYRASCQLGLDISAAGNHDFDFGKDRLEEISLELSYPLLCANAQVSLPAAKLVSTDAGDIGFIGLTSPHLARASDYRADRRGDFPEQGSAVDVVAMARELRRTGASAIVVLLHDGVDWRFGPQGYEADPQRVFAAIAPWSEVVDVVVGGDTLGRHYGSVGAMRFVQPWPFGVEIAVVDLSFSSRGVQIDVGASLVGARRDWDGTGADLIVEAGRDMLGPVRSPLAAHSGGGGLLPTFVAEAIAAASGADIAIGYVACAQPAIDGIFAYVGSGSLSRLQAGQLIPWTRFDLLVTQVTRAESERLHALTAPERSHRSRSWGMQSQGSAPERLSLATTSGAAAHVIATTLGRDLAWEQVGTTVFEGMREVLARGAISDVGSVSARGKVDRRAAANLCGRPL